MGYRILKPHFPLGNVYMTAGVAALELDPDEIARLLHRHQCGGWGTSASRTILPRTLSTRGENPVR